jgi:hypothetical protein
MAWDFGQYRQHLATANFVLIDADSLDAQQIAISHRWDIRQSWIAEPTVAQGI